MRFVTLLLLIASLPFAQTPGDPYASLSGDQKLLLKPIVERYVRDQVTQNWADLWEIQDQTSDMKNELTSNRNAPDLSKNQFVGAMRETIGTGLPRLRSFQLREVKPDKDNFILIGCGSATREDWKKTGIVIAGIRLVSGKAKVDLWSMTPDACS